MRASRHRLGFDGSLSPSTPIQRIGVPTVCKRRHIAHVGTVTESTIMLNGSASPGGIAASGERQSNHSTHSHSTKSKQWDDQESPAGNPCERHICLEYNRSIASCRAMARKMDCQRASHDYSGENTLVQVAAIAASGSLR